MWPVSGGDEVAQVQAALSGKCVKCAALLSDIPPRRGIPEPHGWCAECADEEEWHQCGECGEWFDDLDRDIHRFPQSKDWDWWCTEHASIPDTGCECILCDPDGWCWNCRLYRVEDGSTTCADCDQ